MSWFGIPDRLLGWVFPVDVNPTEAAVPEPVQPGPWLPEPCQSLGHMAIAELDVCDYCGADLLELKQQEAASR